MRNPTTTIWQSRITTEERNYKTWADLFMCNKLEDYWENKQWQLVGGNNSTSYKPYTLNMIYSTIKIKLANIIYQKPRFLLDPMPGHADWDPEMANRSAEIKEAALNTIINHPKAYFVKNLRLAALDSFLRGFGVLEVGYAADWQNPLKVGIATDLDDQVDGTGKSLSKAKVLYDDEIPFNERTFFKHIKARRFRADCNDSPILDHCNWCGYYSFIRKTTLAKTKGIDLPTSIKNEYFAVGMDQKYIKRTAKEDGNSDYLNSQSYFKVWTVFDNIKKEKNLVLETTGYPIIWSAPFDRLPFPHVVWDDRAPSKENIGFYPMPPVFQWISPQDEINQAREQLRTYRKRGIRKFWYNNNVLPDEINKLSTNTDGEAIKLKGSVTGEQALGLLPNAEAGSSLLQMFEVSTSDLNVITGTSANARQQTDRTTATESTIIDQRAQIRESVEQLDFTDFVCAAGRETLLTMIERFSENMWVKMTLDPSEDFMSEYQDSQAVYQYIENQEITDGSYDWDISLDVTNATPAQMAEEKKKFIEFLTIVFSQPQIALSPILLRETAAKVGYKNERVIRELQKAATMHMVQQMQLNQGGGQQGGGGVLPNNGGAASMNSNSNPNPTAEIQKQMIQQLGMNK